MPLVSGLLGTDLVRIVRIVYILSSLVLVVGPRFCWICRVLIDLLLQGKCTQGGARRRRRRRRHDGAVQRRGVLVG